MKQVEFTDNVQSFTSYQFKPLLKTLGPKLGKLVGELRKVLDTIDGNEAMKELDETGELKVVLGGQQVSIAKEDLLIETAQLEGFESDSDYGITVVLDTNLTPELIEEGFVRELISKIQTMRKDAGFEVMDHITVFERGNEKIKQIMERNEETICGDVLGDGIVYEEMDGYTKEWNINGENVELGVKKK